MRNSCGGNAEKLRNGECAATRAAVALWASSNTAHPQHSRPPQGGFSPPSQQASGIVTPQQRETGQVPPRSGSTGTGPVLGRPSHRPPCSKFEQQQTAEEAAALVVLCARKHRRRTRLLTLISQHTRTKANHHLELTKRFEGGVASACASGAPPVRLRCASAASCLPHSPRHLTRPSRGSRRETLARDRCRGGGGRTSATTTFHRVRPADGGGDAGVSSVLLRR